MSITTCVISSLFTSPSINDHHPGEIKFKGISQMNEPPYNKTNRFICQIFKLVINHNKQPDIFHYYVNRIRPNIEFVSKYLFYLLKKLNVRKHTIFIYFALCLHICKQSLKYMIFVCTLSSKLTVMLLLKPRQKNKKDQVNLFLFSILSRQMHIFCCHFSSTCNTPFVVAILKLSI